MSLNKNDIITLDITAMSSDGSGIGRIDDLVVFVPNTAVGDKIRAKVVKVLKSYAFARLEDIILPSDDRIKNNCPVFEKCGGCAYRHISYEAECQNKTAQVYHNIKSIAKIPYTEEKIVCNNEKTERYRNKGQYPVGLNEKGEVVFGFYAPRSHRIIPVSDCLLQPEIFSEILKEIRVFVTQNNLSVYNEQTKKGTLRHVYLRRGEVSGEIMVCLVVNGKTFTDKEELCKRLTGKFSQIKSIILNVNTAHSNVILGENCITLWGSDTISDVMCGLTVKLSALSFYQVNHDMAESVYRLAKELIQPKESDTLLDLYCGAGLIGLSFADSVKEVVGIEVVPEAIENAKQNAKANSIKNAQFYCGDASLILKLLEDGYKFDIAVIDPPRKGCSSEVLKALSQCGAEKIVYISCNSATLARDLGYLNENGYRAERIIPADLFPKTIHCECLALLIRK